MARTRRAGERHFDKLLLSRAKMRRVRHQRAMLYADLPAFMVELRRGEGTSARCLEFVILTAARTGEAIGALWPEIDLLARLWTVPGEWTKSGRVHRVPYPIVPLSFFPAFGASPAMISCSRGPVRGMGFPIWLCSS